MTSDDEVRLRALEAAIRLHGSKSGIEGTVRGLLTTADEFAQYVFTGTPRPQAALGTRPKAGPATGT